MAMQSENLPSTDWWQPEYSTRWPGAAELSHPDHGALRSADPIKKSTYRFSLPQSWRPLADRRPSGRSTYSSPPCRYCVAPDYPWCRWHKAYAAPARPYSYRPISSKYFYSG